MNSWWHDLGPQVQQAIVGGLIGGTFTVLTASIGVAIVFYQIRRQAVNTIAANKHNEALKLKKQVYDEVIKASRELALKEQDLSSVVMSHLYELVEAKTLEGSARMRWPTRRYQELVTLRNAVIPEVERCMVLIANWAIVHASMMHHYHALADVVSELQLSTSSYVTLVWPTFPTDQEERTDKYRWIPPSDELLEDIYNAALDADEDLAKLSTWLHEFGRDMQNVLLGELFDRSISRTRLERLDVFASDHAKRYTRQFADRRAAKKAESMQPPPLQGSS